MNSLILQSRQYESPRNSVASESKKSKLENIELPKMENLLFDSWREIRGLSWVFLNDLEDDF